MYISIPRVYFLFARLFIRSRKGIYDARKKMVIAFHGSPLLQRGFYYVNGVAWACT